MPVVPLPSLITWLNGTSFFTAALYSRTVFKKPSGFTPSSLVASSSSVLALTLVMNLIRYSERKQFADLGIEHLPCELRRLLQHCAAVFRVSERMKIGAFVDEALAVGVDQQAEDVAVLLELIADRHVAELGRIAIPAGGMTARPVAVGCCADVERHVESVALVEARAAHFAEFPARAEVARAHFGVRLEAAAREHHRFRAQFDRLAFVLRAHAGYACAVEYQRRYARVVLNRNAVLQRRLVEIIDEAGAAAVDFDRHVAEVHALAVDHARLPAVVQDELGALGAQPRHGLEALRDQDFGKIGIGAETGEPEQHVEEFVGGVGAEIAVGGFLVGDVGDAPQIFEAFVREAHHAAGEAAVAAVLVFGGRFEDQNFGAVFLRGERCAQRRVAFAYYDDIVFHVFQASWLNPSWKGVITKRSGQDLQVRGRGSGRVRSMHELTVL